MRNFPAAFFSTEYLDSTKKGWTTISNSKDCGLIVVDCWGTQELMKVWTVVTGGGGVVTEVSEQGSPGLPAIPDPALTC